MKKYISPSINANYFRECILDYLTEVHHYPKSELIVNDIYNFLNVEIKRT